MRISDWSSDVCSSDLHDEAVETLAMAIRQPNAHYHLVALAAVCDALAGREAEARRNLGRLHEAAPEYGEREFRRAFQFQQPAHAQLIRSEEHTSELQSLMRISYAVFWW